MSSNPRNAAQDGFCSYLIINDHRSGAGGRRGRPFLPSSPNSGLPLLLWANGGRPRALNTLSHGNESCGHPAGHRSPWSPWSPWSPRCPHSHPHFLWLGPLTKSDFPSFAQRARLRRRHCTPVFSPSEFTGSRRDASERPQSSTQGSGSWRGESRKNG